MNMTNEDKIIQLFESGQYELAYQLRDSLNIDIDYSKIDLIKMVMELSNTTELYIYSKSNLKFEIEITQRVRNYPKFDWISYGRNMSDNFKFVESLKNLIQNKYDIPCKISYYRDDDSFSLEIYNLYKSKREKHYGKIEEIIPKFIKYLFES